MGSVLIIDDERPVTDAFASFFERHGGHSVACAYTGADGIAVFEATRPDVVLLDLRLPDMTGFDVYARIREHAPVVIMISGHGDIPLAVQAMQAGAENFLTKPVDLQHLAVVAERAFEKVRLRQLNHYLSERRNGHAPAFALGGSSVMRDLASQIELLAASERTTVLLLGESGSGKGRVAELIHAHSPRRDAPFVELNCAALTADALEVSLFGQDVSANGGKEPRVGLFEVAAGGTLFLDEIADLGTHLQARLLRVLEAKAFRRVDGTREIMSDARIIAATNRDLVTEVNEGRFREDLYYRLSVMPVYLPPLRARSREDVVELIGRIVDELRPHLPAAPHAVTDAALERLLRHPWPGNIRELRNVLERAMIVGRGAERVEPQHLPAEVREPSGQVMEHHIPRTLEEVERVHIERTLRMNNANRTHAARELGISRATLIKKIKEFGIASRTR
ncbi:MAG TPA: sigma-54 dependent transcriptional regulator [Gemmatimonadaceae bacterium]|jgi:DNA-binding NtrC family response regulator|nr:sigma-54 dependent transcriptional regulator [Gemmatimonadaceae bacterium]